MGRFVWAVISANGTDSIDLYEQFADALEMWDFATDYIDSGISAERWKSEVSRYYYMCECDGSLDAPHRVTHKTVTLRKLDIN